ncbi:MAG: alkaline phosphatase D family protein [Longimicrobiales bacterium]
MKTRDPQWFDLFQARGTRRDFLRVGGAAAGLVALGALPGCGAARGPRLSDDPFTLGVASGDPASDGLVLWTRLARSVLDGAGTADRAVPVTWEVAHDDAFTRIAGRGETLAIPELGHSVHAEVAGLEPGRGYVYRFRAGGITSPVGRGRTAPAPGVLADRVRFAFASCQNYEHGYYTALGHLAEEDLDFVVHLGDYIYEKRFGGPEVRAHEGGEVITLDEYRGRYTTYRTDPLLQAAHAAAPWVCTTDDHEVDNNWAGPHAEDDQSPETLLLRRAAAYQAFYEFMPLRRSSMPTGPDAQLYRRLSFGSLVEMFALDTRQYRSDQPCGDRTQPTCAAHVAPDQSILGAAQREWLLSGMTSSQARWNVMAQQVMVARLRGRQDDGTETWAMDMWDGYPRERTVVLNALADGGVANPVVLTGDIHSSWVANLHRDFDAPDQPPVATEFAGTSITSGGDGVDVSQGALGVLERNPHLHFYDGRRGYVVATVEPERWTTDYRIVPYVEREGAPVETRATFVVENGRPGAERV